MAIPTDKLVRQHASIGIPGAWIEDDNPLDATVIKVGGIAKYFYLWQKTKEQVDCLSCKHKMYLLTQINAPLMAEQCQRNVYIFMCRNPKCTKTGKGWKGIVQRGPKITANTINYHNKPDNNDNNEKNQNNNNDIHALIKHNNKTKANNNKTNTTKCESFWNKDLKNKTETETKTKTIATPQKTGQMQTKMDGLNDDFAKLMALQQKLLNEVDKQQNNQNSKRKKKNKVTQKVTQKMKVQKGTFTPFQLAFRDEGYYKNAIKNKSDMSDEIIKWNNKEINVKKLMDIDDDVKCEEMDNLEGDLLSDYLARISLEKTQCVRYCYGGHPLLPNKLDLNVPNCKHCGNKKVFEFQIMSATLNYLEPKQIDHEWLTVLVFVCPLTCQLSDEQHIVVCCEQ